MGAPFLVKELINFNSNSWDQQLLDLFFCDQDKEAIRSIPIGARNVEDSIIWPLNPNGHYSVKSGYCFLKEQTESKYDASPSEDPKNNKRFWSEVWNIPSIPRVKNFIWRAIHNSLPTLENLSKRHKAHSTDCPRCGEKESLEHVMFLYPFAQMTWRVSNFGYSPRIEGFSSFSLWWYRTGMMMEKENLQDSMSLIAQLCYMLWRARNELVFDKVVTSPLAVWNKAASMQAEENDNSSSERDASREQEHRSQLGRRQAWVPPPRGSLKFNCSVIKGKNDTSAGIGILARDHEGQVKGIFGKKIQSVSARIDAAEALRTGCRFMKNFQWENYILEGCNQGLIRSFHRKAFSSWESKTIEQDILQICGNANYSFSWVSRKSNSCANWIAGECLMNSYFVYDVENIPADLQYMLNNDWHNVIQV